MEPLMKKIALLLGTQNKIFADLRQQLVACVC